MVAFGPLGDLTPMLTGHALAVAGGDEEVEHEYRMAGTSEGRGPGSNGVVRSVQIGDALGAHPMTGI